MKPSSFSYTETRATINQTGNLIISYNYTYTAPNTDIRFSVLQRYARIGAGIIESGSNSNGSWIKYGDGTMEQWGTKSNTITVATAYGGIFYGNFGAITFPVAFLAGIIPDVGIYAVHSTGGITWAAGATGDTRTNTGVTATNIVSPISRTGFIQACSWRAIGRWRA